MFGGTFAGTFALTNRFLANGLGENVRSDVSEADVSGSAFEVHSSGMESEPKRLMRELNCSGESDTYRPDRREDRYWLLNV